jgi:hypothetical protein
MALLIYSNRCSHSQEILQFVDKHAQLKQVIRLHDVNTMGIPPQYRQKITRVPTLLTKDGRFLVGKEAKAWLASILPEPVISSCDMYGRCTMTNLDGSADGNFFSLDNYGQSLQPPMTEELQKKINASVSDAFSAVQS